MDFIQRIFEIAEPAEGMREIVWRTGGFYFTQVQYVEEWNCLENSKFRRGDMWWITREIGSSKYCD